MRPPLDMVPEACTLLVCAETAASRRADTWRVVACPLLLRLHRPCREQAGRGAGSELARIAGPTALIRSIAEVRQGQG